MREDDEVSGRLEKNAISIELWNLEHNDAIFSGKKQFKYKKTKM